jgi:predicted Zn finger-like uncharacterized protein
MFTQCSKCETVFRVPAQALRAAGGQVRCGRCGDVFNALARLAEDSAEFTRGESSVEQESRAAEILQSSEAVEPAVTAETPNVTAIEAPDAAPEQPVPDAMLEFTLPPTELDRIFIETTPSVLQLLAAEGGRSGRGSILHADGPTAPAAEPVQSAPGEIASVEPSHSETHAGRVVILPDDLDLDLEDSPWKAASRDPAVPAQSSRSAPRSRHAPEPSAARFEPSAAKPAPSLAVAAPQALRSRNAEPSEPPMPEIGALRRRLYYPAWVSAAVVFALLLAAQVVMTQTDWFASHPTLASPAAAARAQLSIYQLQQWGVTGDPDAKGTLHVHASILNSAAHAVPYPLLRVTLADRFGTRIGRREFEPAEYLGKPPAGMLAAGDRTDAALDVQDPGQEAEAFEIDVCLRNGDKVITCAGEVAETGAAAQRK